MIIRALITIHFCRKIKIFSYLQFLQNLIVLTERNCLTKPKRKPFPVQKLQLSKNTIFILPYHCGQTVTN